MNFMSQAEAKPTGRSPYVDGRREWNERYGDYIAQRDNWRRFAFGCLGVAALSVAGNVWQSVQARVQPFVVAVDKLGDQIAVGPVEASPRDDPRVVRAQLARWIVNIRTVTTDPEAATRNVDDAYALTDKNGSALADLNEWYAAHSPYTRAASGTVRATVTYVRLRAGHTWLVGWREEERPLSGPAPAPRDWEAEVVVATSPPMDAEGIQANATGSYVTSFNWGLR